MSDQPGLKSALTVDANNVGASAPDLSHLLAGLNAVLDKLKSQFVDKDTIIDLLGVCLAGGENLFLLGPPGTAKSALVHGMGRLLQGKTFDYLLTSFSEPNELFGPFDIRRLREGELVTNTDGMLPEADLVFLDELLHANSAILNALLMALNERMFRRGRENRKLPALCFIGASNNLPEDEALRALFDRFLLRALCDNVSSAQLGAVLDAGWKLEEQKVAAANINSSQAAPALGVSADDIRKIQSLIPQVDLSAVREVYLALINNLRNAGISISDRRAVKLQRVIAASAVLCGRMRVRNSDLWVLRHIWDNAEQREVIAAIVNQSLKDAEPASDDHSQARAAAAPNPEQLATDLKQMQTVLEQSSANPADRSAADLTVLSDKLTLLAGRIQWVENDMQRAALQEQVDTLWKKLKTS